MRLSGLVAAALAVLAAISPACCGAARAAGGAHAARSQRLAITARLRYVDARGAYLIEEGAISSGALAGTINASIRVRAEIAGSFTLHAPGGSITGRGTAVLHESGVYASFGGTLKIIGGTGRYAHASGDAGLYGVYDRETLGFTIQTTGTLSF